MKPGFWFNDHSRETNPLFEAHDPSMMYDPISECYYSYATDAAITSQYKQGIPIRKSTNLIDFTFVGYALSKESIKEARDNGEHEPTGGFWAPYAEYVPEENEYRLYYSATKAFGSWESKIWLAVSKHPEGPFENRGVVANTWENSPSSPNAIDPHIIDTVEGEKYLVYGSFFGGIYIKELNRHLGLSADLNEKSLGTCIAVKPKNSTIDGPEGAAIMYHSGTKYYYLFQSYGWLGNSYDIRVGRSHHVMGPYVDENGISLTKGAHGLKLAGSYQFTAFKPNAKSGNENWTYGGFRGPGHGVPFFDPKTETYFFVHHVRDGAKEFRYPPDQIHQEHTYRMHYMVVRRMYFLEDWPILSPEPYAGEESAERHSIEIEIKDGKISYINKKKELILYQEEIKSPWEWICFDGDDNSQKIAKSSMWNCSYAKVMIGYSFDFENSKECMTVCGLTNERKTIWGKQIV